MRQKLVAVVVASAAAAAACSTSLSDGPLLASSSEVAVCGVAPAFEDFVLAVDVVNDSTDPIVVTGIRAVGAENVEATGDVWLLPTDEGGLLAYPFEDLSEISYWELATPIGSGPVPPEEDRMQVVARFVLSDPTEAGSLEGFDIEYLDAGGNEFLTHGNTGIVVQGVGEKC